MRISRSQRKHLDKLEKDVFQNNDFKRHIQETAIKLNLSPELIETVMKNYLTNAVLHIYVSLDMYKRIVVYHFIKLFIKPFRKKNNT